MIWNNKGVSLIEVSLSVGMIGMISLNASQLFFRTNQFSQQANLMTELDMLTSRISTSVNRSDSCGVLMNQLQGQVGGAINLGNNATNPNFTSINKISKDPNTREYVDTGDVILQVAGGGAQTVAAPIGPQKPFSIFYYTDEIALRRLGTSNSLQMRLRFQKVPDAETIWASTITRVINFKASFEGNTIVDCQALTSERYEEELNNACTQVTGDDQATRDASGARDPVTGEMLACDRFTYDLSANCSGAGQFVVGFQLDPATKVISPVCGGESLNVADCPAGERPVAYDAAGNGNWGDFNCEPLDPTDMTAPAGPGPDNCTPRGAPQGGAVITNLNLANPFGISCD